MRALRFWGPFPLWAHWDETRLAAPAIGILDGELPVHHLGVEYMGATPAYPLAVWFALVGRSTFTLDLFAYAAGIAMFLWAGSWLGDCSCRRPRASPLRASSPRRCSSPAGA